MSFLTSNELFDLKWSFWPQRIFLNANEIFDLKGSFWPQMSFLTSNELFDLKWDFWPQMRFLTSNDFFDLKGSFWTQMSFLTSKGLFGPKWPSLCPKLYMIYKMAHISSFFNDRKTSKKELEIRLLACEPARMGKILFIVPQNISWVVQDSLGNFRIFLRLRSLCRHRFHTKCHKVTDS